jgi:hypothetical protein
MRDARRVGAAPALTLPTVGMHHDAMADSIRAARSRHTMAHGPHALPAPDARAPFESAPSLDRVLARRAPGVGRTFSMVLPAAPSQAMRATA